MPLIRYRKTWATITHESAERGEVEHRGLVDIADTHWTLDEVQRGEHGSDEARVYYSTMEVDK